MSRNAVAVAILLGLSVAGPVAARQTSVQPSAQAASAQERASYERADALARSVFWGREQQIDPADPVAGVKLAQALRELGQFEQAAATAQSVLMVQPANTDAMLEIGKAHIARGQAFYGIAALEQARAIKPTDWRPLSLLGVAYEQVKRTADARAAWNEGLRLSPDNPEILTNAAMALATSGDAPGAETLLRRAVAQPGATIKMRSNLALVLGLQGKTGEAEQIIRRDLPPEAAERNLQWLRAQTSGRGSSPVAGEAPSGNGRTWNSLQSN